MCSKPTSKGLTLVELLIAISVLGVVAVLGWRGLDSIVRARIALTVGLEQTRGIQLAFAQLQSDCAHLASTAMLPNRVSLAVNHEHLSLVRTVFSDDQPTRLQVVTYRINNGVMTRSGSVATRNLRELDSLWLATTNDTDTTQSVELQSGVNAMTMRLWGGNSWQTVNALPPSTTVSPVIPSGLEVTLKLRGRDTGMTKIFMLGAV